MGVKKTYTYAEVKSAIDIANEQFFNTLVRVRSDVSVRDWGRTRVGVERDESGAPKDPTAWRGRGSDVGHAFRHVDDTAPTGKSVYRDDDTAVRVTMELLNSEVGQEKLEALDSDQPDDAEPDSTNNRKITTAVTGDWYGADHRGGDLKKIAKASCQIMKLARNTLGFTPLTRPSSSQTCSSSWNGFASPSVTQIVSGRPKEGHFVTRAPQLCVCRATSP